MFSLTNRGRIKDQATIQEFERLYAKLRGFLSQAFDEDGNLIVADPNLAVVPVGAVQDFAGTAAPTGWLLCDGAQVSRQTYKSLYDVIGTTFGAGDGSTTFNLPDCRGRFALAKAAAGTGSALGSTGGTLDLTHVHSVGAHSHSAGSLTTNTVNDHSHSISNSGEHSHSVNLGTSVESGFTTDVTGAGGGTRTDTHQHTVNGNTNNGGNHNHGGSTGGGGGHSHTLNGNTGNSGAFNTGNPSETLVPLTWSSTRSSSRVCRSDETIAARLHGR